jgi:hypothetical protein
MTVLTDRVWAEEPGVEVSAVVDGGTVVVTIIKDSVPIATATLGQWRWERLHKIKAWVLENQYNQIDITPR